MQLRAQGRSRKRWRVRGAKSCKLRLFSSRPVPWTRQETLTPCVGAVFAADERLSAMAAFWGVKERQAVARRIAADQADTEYKQHHRCE